MSDTRHTTLFGDPGKIIEIIRHHLENPASLVETIAGTVGLEIQGARSVEQLDELFIFLNEYKLADKVRILELRGGNIIDQLPPSYKFLKNLIRLAIREHNDEVNADTGCYTKEPEEKARSTAYFTQLPEDLGDSLPHLRELIVKGTLINRLPDSLARLGLYYVNLHHNYKLRKAIESDIKTVMSAAIIKTLSRARVLRLNENVSEHIDKEKMTLYWPFRASTSISNSSTSFVNHLSPISGVSSSSSGSVKEQSSAMDESHAHDGAHAKRKRTSSSSTSFVNHPSPIWSASSSSSSSVEEQKQMSDDTHAKRGRLS